MPRNCIGPDRAPGRSSPGPRVLQTSERGLDVAVWVNGLADDTSYFACRRDDRQKLDDLLDGLQAAGIIERGFLESRTHQLFCRLDSGAEDDGPNKPPENTGSAGP